MPAETPRVSFYWACQDEIYRSLAYGCCRRAARQCCIRSHRSHCQGSAQKALRNRAEVYHFARTRPLVCPAGFHQLRSSGQLATELGISCRATCRWATQLNSRRSTPGFSGHEVRLAQSTLLVKVPDVKKQFLVRTVNVERFRGSDASDSRKQYIAL